MNTENPDIKSNFPGKNVLKLQYVKPYEMEVFQRFLKLPRETLIQYLIEKCQIYCNDDTKDRKDIVEATLERLRGDSIFSGTEQELFPVFVPLEQKFFAQVFSKEMRPKNRKDFRAIQEREKNLGDDGVFDRIDAWKKTLPENYTFSPNDLLQFLSEKAIEHFRDHLKENGIELSESLLHEIGNISYESPIRRQEWKLACDCADCGSFEDDYQAIWFDANNGELTLEDSE